MKHSDRRVLKRTRELGGGVALPLGDPSRAKPRERMLRQRESDRSVHLAGAR